jgi:hypothetical protein
MNKLVLVDATQIHVPALIARAGQPAARRFLEFSTAHIRNPNTRAAVVRKNVIRYSNQVDSCETIAKC